MVPKDAKGREEGSNLDVKFTKEPVKTDYAHYKLCRAKQPA